MTGCSAINCTNSSEKKWRLFAFPTDPIRRAKWLQNTRKVNWEPGKGSKLCEAHFEESQFEQYRQDGWKKLKPNAVPTLFNIPDPPPGNNASRISGNKLSETIKMPGVTCGVAGCRNNYQVNKRIGKKCVLHIFPKAKDLTSQKVRKEWIRRCNRKGKFNPDTARICSEHFVDDDYERDLQNELLGLPQKKVLKKTAVPTVKIHKNLLRKCDFICDESKDDIIIQIVEEVPDKMTESDSKFLKSEENSTDHSSFLPSFEICEYPSPDENYEEKYKRLLNEYNTLNMKFNELKQISEKQIEALNRQVRYYEAKVAETLIVPKEEPKLEI